MALNARQKSFADHFLIVMSKTDAARLAGYSEKTATSQGERLSKHPEVAAYIQAAMDKRAERTHIDQDYVLESIASTMERCKQVEPVLDRRGEPVLVETPTGDLAPAYTFNAAGVLKGAELLGKHLGMFSGDAPQITVNIPFDGWELERAKSNALDGD
tara:strand:- start:3550 stop:4023 length:474 start_codon:yes stop_codon:yes gene_type:complete